MVLKSSNVFCTSYRTVAYICCSKRRIEYRRSVSLVNDYDFFVAVKVVSLKIVTGCVVLPVSLAVQVSETTSSTACAAAVVLLLLLLHLSGSTQSYLCR